MTRLVVEPEQRPRYTLDELLAQCNPKAPRSMREREWDDRPAPRRRADPDEAAAKSDWWDYGAPGRDMSKGPTAGAHRVAGGVQPGNESAPWSSDHQRREFRAHPTGFAVTFDAAGTA